jgi:hypothetical protein
MNTTFPLVRIAFVSLLLSLAGLLTAFSLRGHSTLPLFYLPEVQIQVAPQAAGSVDG